MRAAVAAPRARATRCASIRRPRSCARWYAACDLLLMTSGFEGVPYVIFEAHRHGRCRWWRRRCRATASCSNGDGGIADRVRAIRAAYTYRARAAHRRPRSAATGSASAAAARVLEDFSLRADGRGSRAALRAAPGDRHASGAPPRRHGRRSSRRARSASGPAHCAGPPLVSVVIPSLQPRPLPRWSALASIRGADLPARSRSIVVDDASTDAGHRPSARLSSSSGTSVTRDPPGAATAVRARARNVGIELGAGPLRAPASTPTTCCFPMPSRRSSRSSPEAGETIGFIYPNHPVLRQPRGLLRGSGLQPRPAADAATTATPAR